VPGNGFAAIIAALAVGILAVLGARVDYARAEEGASRVGLVMSKLPPPRSKEYKQLRKVAGPATGQALAMTHAEVWNVPPERVEELLAAAAAKGVVVTRLDESWNHMLAPMKEGAQMSAEQNSMMSKAMDSKAAMGMNMMALPQASVMEYALTKDMDRATAKGASQTIVIPLSKDTVVTARRSSVKPSGDGLVWHGSVADTDEPVTLMWWPGGRLTGSVTYKGHVYAIRNMGDEMHGVVEMAPNMLPPEHAPAGLDQMKKMKMLEDPFVSKGDASMMMDKPPAKVDSVGPKRGDTRNLEDAPDKGANKSHLGAPVGVAKAKSGRKHASRPKQITITLLVAYTKKAASYYADIRTDLIAMAIEDANQALANSGIDDVNFELAGTQETDYVESGSHFDHLYKLLQRNDGVMDEIPKLRDSMKADVVVLIVHDPMGCGLSAKVAADAEMAYAVVHHECAATSYSLAHELGHIIGARHETALDQGTDPFPFGHGFVNGKAWRTMMSYKESCDGCPRLPVWSNPSVRIKGVRAGDATTNNAEVIRRRAAIVAGFR
jgi:hypothetical protein